MTRGLGTNIQAGYKAGRTRKRNILRWKAMNYLGELAKQNNWLIPTILRHPEGGVELSLSFGADYIFLRFKTRAEALDYIIALLPHC